MRKLAALVLFVFALCLDSGSGSAWAQSGSATFRLMNNARYQIFLKFYSPTHVWPGASNHFTLADNGEHSFPLACDVGEKICYGAGYSQDGSGAYWGVGFLGDQGCSQCCLICGPNNPSASWSLND